MKRILGILSVFIFAIIISGCKCKKDEDSKVSLAIGDMSATTYKEIGISTLDEMISEDESFLLYIFNSDCGGCKVFSPIINSVIVEKHLIVYAIEDIEIPQNHTLKSLDTTPSLVLYNQGELFFKTEYEDNKDYFDSANGFKKFLDKYTYMPTMYYISKTQLDSKIANDESFVVYYSRNNCSDCTYVNSHFLKDYLNKNVSTKHFYVIETNVEGIRLNNGSYDEAQWIQFKNDYGLSNVNNPLGHGVGYVPTFQYYENGSISDMLVYFNDCVYSSDYSQVTITSESSYYDDNPYIGQTMPTSEYKDKLAPFYNEKLKAFLDTNLAKVD